MSDAVGVRATELHAVDTALALALSGRGGSLVLAGDAGMGKTWLITEAMRRARRAGLTVMRGRATGHTLRLRALREALASFTRESGADYRNALGPYAAVLGRLIPEWSSDPDISDADQLVLAEGLLRLLGEVGRERGCVLLLDDLHHADPETVAVLDYLMDNVADRPIALIGSMRLDDTPMAAVVEAAVRRQVCVHMRLEPVSAARLGSLIRVWLGGSERLAPELVQQLWASSLGQPAAAEQQLHDMLLTNAVRLGSDGWRLDDQATIPSSLSRAIVAQAESVAATRLLTTAAVFGDPFPLAPVQSMLALSDAQAHASVHAAMEAQLIRASNELGWYGFTHPWAGQAFLPDSDPGLRIDLARRAAQTIARLHPGLPGDWCGLAASLHLAAGDHPGAGRLYALAGRRTLAAGAASGAVALFDRALDLLDGSEKATVLAELVAALAEAGQVDRALSYVSALDEVSTEFDTRCRAELHARLAWAACLAGRIEDGFIQVAAARAIRGKEIDAATALRLDLIAAHLTMELPGRRHAIRAERLARQCMAEAERIGSPAEACQAGILIGCLIRQRNMLASTSILDRVNGIASANRLPVWELRTLIRLGGNDSLHDGSLDRLYQARQLAQRMGAVAAGYEAEANIAMQIVLRGDFDAAEPLIESVQAASARIRLTEIAQYMLVTRSVLDAHRGRRRDMDRSLAAFRHWGGDTSHHVPLVLGLARGICALLEEDRSRAIAEMESAMRWEDERFTTFQLTGRYGLLPLLAVLNGDLGPFRTVRRATAGQRRWNRQFLRLAHAVVLGREGEGQKAIAAVHQAGESAKPYQMAYHLGLRLVAEAALADGWGEPVSWLRDAEAYFAAANILPVASACRGMLRQAGVPVRQRRLGVDLIPRDLRALGITVREFEILQLLATRPANSEIADRLHLSTRTVEKHVANLMRKTKCTSRVGLSDLAAGIMRG